jgi:hypothetical protein
MVVPDAITSKYLVPTKSTPSGKKDMDSCGRWDPTDI